jgi:hypothetical protein
MGNFKNLLIRDMFYFIQGECQYNTTTTTTTIVTNVFMLEI